MPGQRASRNAFLISLFCLVDNGRPDPWFLRELFGTGRVSGLWRWGACSDRVRALPRGKGAVYGPSKAFDLNFLHHSMGLLARAQANRRSFVMRARTERADAPKKNGAPPPALHAGTNGAAVLKTTIDQEALLRALQAMRIGDFSVRMAGDQIGIAGKIADAFNDIVAANQRMAQQLERVGEVVGKEGKTRQRVKFGLHSGAWGEMENSVNALIDDLLWPTAEVTRAIAAVAQGDLLQIVRMDVDGRPLKGEFLRSADIVNTMIKQLSVFTSEVTRVAREVGTEGKLGGQAQVKGVTGVWKDLTESVNSMASNL